MPNSNLIVPLTVPAMGGGLWIETAGGDECRQVTPKKRVAGRVYPLRTLTPMALDPHKWHGSEPWDLGSRVLLVAYSLKGYEKASDDQKRVLKEVGFLLPRSSCEGCFEKEGVDGNSRVSPSNTAEGGVVASRETSSVSSSLDGGIAAPGKCLGRGRMGPKWRVLCLGREAVRLFRDGFLGSSSSL